MSLPLSREGGREGKREGGREGGRDWRKQVCKPWTVGVTTRQRGRKGWRRRMTGTGIMTRREGEREGRGKERKNRDGFDFSSYLRYVIYFSDSVDGEGGEEGWKVKDSAVERIAVSYGIGRREGGRGGGGEGGRAGRRYDYARLLELERSEKKAIRKEKLAAQGEEKEREGGRKGGKEEESRAVVINSFLPPSLPPSLPPRSGLVAPAGSAAVRRKAKKEKEKEERREARRQEVAKALGRNRGKQGRGRRRRSLSSSSSSSPSSSSSSFSPVSARVRCVSCSLYPPLPPVSEHAALLLCFHALCLAIYLFVSLSPFLPSLCSLFYTSIPLPSDHTTAEARPTTRKEGGREEGREGGRDGGRERGREGGREGGSEGGAEAEKGGIGAAALGTWAEKRSRELV
jgi:hypothetical protein